MNRLSLNYVKSEEKLNSEVFDWLEETQLLKFHQIPAQSLFIKIKQIYFKTFCAVTSKARLLWMEIKEKLGWPTRKPCKKRVPTEW